MTLNSFFKLPPNEQCMCRVFHGTLHSVMRLLYLYLLNIVISFDSCVQLSNKFCIFVEYFNTGYINS